MIGSSSLLILGLGVLVRTYINPSTHGVKAWGDPPSQAQRISQLGFNVLGNVPPGSQQNGSTLFFPPGTSEQSLVDRPFHIYDEEFFNIIGSNPTLTVIASTSGDPLFHEATTWYPDTDEMFFVQNAGAPAAGTGLRKSAVIEKISLSQVQSVTAASGGSRNVSGQVTVSVVNTTIQVVNPNGGTNFMGDIVFTAEGQGSNIPPAIYQVNPNPPYDTKVILDNYFGRQFNSLNDVAVNPKNKGLYFTDVTYGNLQDFRPPPALPNQVYRFNYLTGAVTVVADGFNLPNGITFSPDGSKAYISDTGINAGFWGFNYTKPATIYEYSVENDGTWSNRKVFAFVNVGIADGIHCDTAGNVYAGCGDGVNVWNPSGKLLGKIYLGATSANFQFAGSGRMVICAETQLYYATLAAEGARITDYDYSNAY